MFDMVLNTPQRFSEVFTKLYIFLHHITIITGYIISKVVLNENLSHTYIGKSFPQNEIYERGWGNVLIIVRCSRPEMLLRKGVLKICSKFTGEHRCGSAIWRLLLNYVTLLLLIKKFFVWAKEESGSYIYIAFKKYPLKAINFLKCFSWDSIRVRSDITYLLLISYNKYFSQWWS